MKIVVVAETARQFKEYVMSAMDDEIVKIARKTFITHGNKVTARIEGEVEFIFCDSLWTLCGYTFAKDDLLVQVGSWYNIPQSEREAIYRSFNSRVTKK